MFAYAKAKTTDCSLATSNGFRVAGAHIAFNMNCEGASQSDTVIIPLAKYFAMHSSIKHSAPHVRMDMALHTIAFYYKAMSARK